MAGAAGLLSTWLSTAGRACDRKGVTGGSGTRIKGSISKDAPRTVSAVAGLGRSRVCLIVKCSACMPRQGRGITGGGRCAGSVACGIYSPRPGLVAWSSARRVSQHAGSMRAACGQHAGRGSAAGGIVRQAPRASTSDRRTQHIAAAAAGGAHRGSAAARARGSHVCRRTCPNASTGEPDARRRLVGERLRITRPAAGRGQVGQGLVEASARRSSSASIRISRR